MATLKKITRGYIYYELALKKPISRKEQKRIDKGIKRALKWSYAYNYMLSLKKFATKVK